MSTIRTFYRVITEGRQDSSSPLVKTSIDRMFGSMYCSLKFGIDLSMSCIQSTIANHLKVFLWNVLDETFDEIYGRDSFLHIFFILMAVVMKSDHMETRLYRLYDEIEGVENSIEEVKNRLLNIQQQKISEENVYQFLLYFDKLYDKFTDLEKKEFLNSFVEQVDIYEQEQPDGRFLKHIKFRFPVYFGDREIQELCWDNESTVEAVVLLQRKNV